MIRKSCHPILIRGTSWSHLLNIHTPIYHAFSFYNCCILYRGIYFLFLILWFAHFHGVRELCMLLRSSFYMTLYNTFVIFPFCYHLHHCDGGILQFFLFLSLVFYAAYLRSLNSFHTAGSLNIYLSIMGKRKECHTISHIISHDFYFCCSPECQAIYISTYTYHCIPIHLLFWAHGHGIFYIIFMFLFRC